MESDPIIARRPAANAAEDGEDQDSFYAMYNKEIKVN